MDNEKYLNVTVGLMALVALVLLIGKGEVKAYNIIALLAIVALSFAFPFLGMILAIPIFMLSYFEYQDEVWSWWESVKSKGIGG